MAKPLVELPTIQNWSCQSCGQCCHQHGIFITEEDHARIAAQNWEASGEIPPGQELFVREKTPEGGSWHRLAHQPGGACVFLNEQGLCRIHAKFGEPAKPLACRIYPYAFHPAGNKLAVSLRFSCPSVAGNVGRSVTSQRQELRELAELVVPANFKKAEVPLITDRVRLDWPDTLRIVSQLNESLTDAETPVAVKLLQSLFWLDLIAKMKFDKVRGERLEELLAMLAEAAKAEIPAVPENPSRPARIAMTQFRLLAGRYARRDTFFNIDTSWRGRLRQLQIALRLTRGKGTLPGLQQGLADVPLALLETRGHGISEESEEMFTRYFRVKIEGMHFFGLPYYKVPLIEGFQSLALVYPVTLWLARWCAHSRSSDEVTHADVLQALTMVDHQHGYAATFGSWGSRRRVRNLAATGDLQRLITWYAGE